MSTGSKVKMENHDEKRAEEEIFVHCFKENIINKTSETYKA